MKVLFAIGCLALAFCLTTSFVNFGKKPENNPPEVVIVKPTQNDRFLWNTITRYTISIKDKEDGNSAFDEINAKEVLLEVCYLPDAASAKIYTDKKKNEKENSGLTMIRRSDCFTCHASKSKLIGPSFELIAKKYKMINSPVEKLAKNIIDGSTGTWGTTAMPAHKALKASDVKQMVKWILNNGANPNITFYPGIEGAFKTGEKPVTGSAKKVMVLTASYTDHGDSDSINTKYGQYTILLKPAN
ncbi:MAG: c-type cytochrome [Ferruginibacter sp.]